MPATRRDYLLLAKTAARKRPRQLLGILHRKAKNEVVPRVPVDVDERYRRRIPNSLQPDFGPHQRDTNRLRSALSDEERELYQNGCAEVVDDRITLLGRTRTLPDVPSVGPTDERLADLPRLWYLKLAALEPIRWGILGHETPEPCGDFSSRIDGWPRTYARQERIAGRVGYLRGFWTPYAVSLRIVTLCRYGAWNGGLDEEERQFLYKNLLFLANNVEWDVGGNHLIENGAALVFAGVAFLGDGSGERFVRQGLDVLETATERQFLSDGFHYERSPMYHLAVTERLCSAYSVLQAAARDPPDWLAAIVADTCGFLDHLRPPDGRIPLLNDSVFDQALQLETVYRYGRAVGIEPDAPTVAGESDLIWFDTENFSLLIDAGDSGPPTQTAHTHNDPCTVLVWSGEERLVVDTGTFDYRPGERRQLSRSVTAHNTVQVAGCEPVAFGGRFRMADTIETTTAVSNSGSISALTCEYLASASERYRHRRTVYGGPDWLLVWDEIEADGSPSIGRLHAHPSVNIRTDPQLAFSHEAGRDLFVHTFGVDETTVGSAPYYPRFGVEQERSVLELHTQNTEFGYVLGPRAGDARIERNDSGPTTLHVDGESYSLPDDRP